MDASRIEISGPLAPHEEPVWSRLAARGYTALSIANVVRVMAHLSRWLVRERLPLAHLTTHEIARFLRHRRRAGYTCWLSRRGVKPILDYLHGVGVPLPPEDNPVVIPTAIDSVIDTYSDYLRRERGPTPSTAAFYERMARMFLPRDGDVRSTSPAPPVRRCAANASRRMSCGTQRRLNL
jgi:integrase/recombinase XerD